MFPLPWLLGLADSQRRAVAGYMGMLGIGPQPAPSTTVTTATGCRLFRYGGASADGPPVLLVPAPIKTGALWDLAPEVSVVRRFLDTGFDVYRMEWPEWTEADGRVGLAGLVSVYLAGCLEAVCARSEAARVLVCGHSLGGTLGALLAARYPERVAGLILLASPLHFDPASSALDRIADSGGAVSDWLGDAELVPGSLLTLLAVSAAPAAFVAQRCADWLASAVDPARMRLHLQVERWALTERPMPRSLFVDLVERLYRDDGFCRATVAIDGETVGPPGLTQPLVSVLDADCDLVTDASVEPALARLGTDDWSLYRHEGDRDAPLRHVSLLIGKDAHAHVWPRLTSWARRRFPG